MLAFQIGVTTLIGIVVLFGLALVFNFLIIGEDFRDSLGLSAIFTGIVVGLGSVITGIVFLLLWVWGGLG